MLKERRRSRPDLRVVASHNRCPFCHTDVDVEATDWVACRCCLAREHLECRREAQACSGCGDTGPALTLAAVPASRWARPRARRSQARPAASWLGRRLLLGVVILGCAMAVAWDANRRDEAFHISLQSETLAAPAPRELAPDFVIEQLEFLEEQGLLRDAQQRTARAMQEYPQDARLAPRLRWLQQLERGR